MNIEESVPNKISKMYTKHNTSWSSVVYLKNAELI